MESTKTTRCSVEYNGMEFLTAIMFIFNDFYDFDSLCQKIKVIYKDFNNYKKIIIFNPDPSNPSSEMNEFGNYVDDIGKKKKFVNDYIQNFRQSFSNFGQEQIQKVFISGKINRHPEIIELNKNISRIDAKADIYVLLTNGEFVGVSVKQSKDATKSNYSVQKMLGKDCDDKLSLIRKQFLSDNGFPTFNKEQRSLVNELFYPQNTNNIYWQTLKTMISEQKSDIISQIIQPLICSAVPYNMYEYDGETFYSLNKQVELSEVTFEEYTPYYFDSKGNQRNAAKLFYRLTIGEKNYRVEVRWKGNIHNSSPQFQIHEER